MTGSLEAFVPYKVYTDGIDHNGSVIAYTNSIFFTLESSKSIITLNVYQLLLCV